MSKNLKLVLFFTVTVAVAVIGYLYNEHKNSQNVLMSIPAVENNAVNSTAPATGEMPKDTMVKPETKVAHITSDTATTEAVPVETQTNKYKK
jgi:hypothetical protein